MARRQRIPREKITDIKLTPEQRHELNRLWFIWGNNRKKHTHANHRSIQTILEHGEYHPDFFKNDVRLHRIIMKVLSDKGEYDE